MDIMRRRMLQLVGMGAVTIASPRLSSALDAETGGTFKTAMGPTSAAQKPGGTGASSAATTCTFEHPCPKPRNGPHRRHAHTDKR
jgi:hypothetical protein